MASNRLMFRVQSLVAVIVILVFASVLYSSCIEDKCVHVVCSHEGVCVQGHCACPVLYEGDACETAWHEKFTGIWQASETYPKDTTETVKTYMLELTGAADSFFVNNLADSFRVLCRRSSRLEFRFISEYRPDSFYTISNGRGVISEDGRVITGLYSLRTEDTTMTTFFTWTK